MNFHIGASDTSLAWFGNSPWPSQSDDKKLAIGSAMMYLTNARVIANLIFSGLLERHPTLRFVSVESGEPVAAEDHSTYMGVKVGRNDPCPCGSGKKFKQCHGKLA